MDCVHVYCNMIFPLMRLVSLLGLLLKPISKVELGDDPNTVITQELYKRSL